jgi:uncharacterized membrane protein YphA (DoxX/SURF4 family)
MTADSTMVSRTTDSGLVSKSALILLGRFFFTFIFLLVGPNLFKKEEIAATAAQGVPFASVVVPLAGAISLVGGLSVLLGYRAKIGAWLMVLFLVVVTPSMHKFWGLADPKVGAATNGHVPEEPVDPRRCISDYAIRCWTLES